ncbi:MAG TPA: hypothetical protein VFQ65_00995 [Kofleriaceae bacterium]|nr:hypothetical protein [Kofleriaceae bacterium]
MVRLASLVFVVAGCSNHADVRVDAHNADSAADAASKVCATGHTDKLKFTYETSCGNDGGVEFCISANDAATLGAVTAVSSTITCNAGGGRAMCNATPGLLLCSYPTSYPGQCIAQYGAMTDQVWTDMCQLAALPQITEIVATILE